MADTNQDIQATLGKINDTLQTLTDLLAKQSQNGADNTYQKLIDVISGFNSGIIEDLKQLRRDRDKAILKGESPAKITALNNMIQQIESHMDNQKKLVDSFIADMGDVAKKIGEKTNRTDVQFTDEMLRELLNFRVEYAKADKKLKDLNQQLDDARNNNSSQSTIQDLEDQAKEAKKERNKLKRDFVKKHGKDSDMEMAMRDFTRKSSKVQALAADIGQLERDEIANINGITSAYSAHEEQLKRSRDVWNAIKVGVREVFAQLKNGGNLWMKYNAQAISDTKRLGMTSKEEAMGYMKSLMQNSKELARNFGLTAEQAMKMQDVYTKVTGRAAMLTKSQMEDIVASSKLMGEETVQSAMQIMDSMGTTSQTTTELLDKNFARAVNSGLDTVKASEAFVKNMSLANKLNFRSGVDGISKMTILSQRIKMNFQEVASVAEKFSTIEGAIEGSARLQMLGGVGAMYGGNPMQMLYESLSDPEALFERMGKMFGEQAVFDRKTGEAKIDPLQMAIMREQAKAMGMNPEEAIQSAKQQAKLAAIESDFSTNAPSVYQMATEEQRAAIQSKAEYDKETGSWVVKYLDQKGKEQQVDIRNITEAQLQEITKDNIEPVEDIRKQVRRIASELIGTQERLNSMKDQWKTGIAQLIHTPMKWFDSAITGINGSGLWKALTAGGALTGVGIAGLGLYRGASTWISGKIGSLIEENLVGRLGGIGGPGGSSVGGGLGTVSGGQVATNVRSAGRVITPNPSPISAGGGVGGATSALSSAGSKMKAFVGSSRAMLGTGAAAGFAGVVDGIVKWNQADAEKRVADAKIEQARAANNVPGRRRFGNEEFRQREIISENKQTAGHAGAVGSGIGTATGVVIGSIIGSALGPVGTMVGGAIGGWLGSKAGQSIGKSLASEKTGDIVTEHLKEIEKGDEEENFRKIVLPVESIDYNVSLIANRLGIMSAAPARGNVYLDAEAAGQIYTQEVEEGFISPITSTNEEGRPYVRTSQAAPGGNEQYNFRGPIVVKGNVSLIAESVTNKESVTNNGVSEGTMKTIVLNGDNARFTKAPTATPSGNDEYTYQNNIVVKGDTIIRAEAVEAAPLQAMKVNNVDTSETPSTDKGTVSKLNADQLGQQGPLTLNVGGTIDLNLRGSQVGRISDSDIRQLFSENPEIVRYITEAIFKRGILNVNAGGNNNDSTSKRLGWSESLGTSGNGWM